MQTVEDGSTVSGNKTITESTTRQTATSTGTRTTTVNTYDTGEQRTRTDYDISPTVKWEETESGYFDRLDKLGGGPATIHNTRKYEDAEGYIGEVRAQGGGIEDNPQYSNLRAGLMGYFGQRFKTYTSDDAAWRQLVEDAASFNVSPLDLLKEGQAAYLGAGGYGSGGSGGSGGTSKSYTNANKADVRVLANAISEDMIGRRITDKEFDRMLKKVRKEEGKSPTITSSSGNTTRTKQGITNAEREEVMAEILNENPEYREYQMGAGALEYTRQAAEREAAAAETAANALPPSLFRQTLIDLWAFSLQRQS